ncbi:MAG: hypothetical protein WDZ41_05640 [Candidatus Babeliales bacterium]
MHRKFNHKVLVWIFIGLFIAAVVYIFWQRYTPTPPPQPLFENTKEALVD